MRENKTDKKGLAYSIAMAIKYFREQKNMSLTDVEKKCGIAGSYISRIENHHIIPSLETLSIISVNGMGVPLIELVHWANEHLNNNKHKNGWSPTINDLKRLGGEK